MSNERVYYSHDAEVQAIRKRDIRTLFFLIIGTGFGISLTLLFSPTTGKEVRKDLTQSLEKGLNSGRDAMEPVVKRLEDEFAELRHQVEERLK